MTGAWGYHRQGSCQAGFAATLTENGNQLFVGAVGSWYWQGQVFQQNLLNRQDQTSTVEGPQSQDMTYLGYSVASGRFGGSASAVPEDSRPSDSPGVGRLQGSSEDIVVGRPRGGNLRGQVQIYNEKLTLLSNITGDQLGSYFGYSVAVGDLNGDGLDDIVVGAPWYSGGAGRSLKDQRPASSYSAGSNRRDNNNGQGEGRRNSENKIETGMIATYLQTPQHNFVASTRVFGPHSRGHFGLSVACLGDINLDGYDDIAVGAPRTLALGTEGGGARGGRGAVENDSTGAVYIFLGSKNGLQRAPAQVLWPRDLTSATVHAFGWSLSGAKDLDGNEYPDLAIGAEESSRAFVLRARPVVHVSSTLTFGSSGGLQNSGFDLSSEGCSLSDGTSVACLPLHYCLQYRGTSLPPLIDLVVELKLDTRPIFGPPRMHFLSLEGVSSRKFKLQLTGGRRSCDSDWIYITPQIQDKLSPLAAELTYELLHRNAPPASYFETPLDLSSRPPSPLSALSTPTRLSPNAQSVSERRYPERLSPRDRSSRYPFILEKSSQGTAFHGPNPSNPNYIHPNPRGSNYLNANPKPRSSIRAPGVFQSSSSRRRVRRKRRVTKSVPHAGSNPTGKAVGFLDIETDERNHLSRKKPPLFGNSFIAMSNGSFSLDAMLSYNEKFVHFPTLGSEMWFHNFTNTLNDDRLDDSISNNSLTASGKKSHSSQNFRTFQQSASMNPSSAEDLTNNPKENSEKIETNGRVRRQSPIVEDYSGFAQSFTSKGNDLLPILPPDTPESPRSVSALVHIRNNCGPDKLCLPDLRAKLYLLGTNGSRYVSGSRAPLILRLTITNSGEDAYLSRALVWTATAGVRFNKFDVVDAPPEITPVCSATPSARRQEDNAEEIACDVGNPFPSSGRIDLNLTFQPIPELILAQALEFQVSVNSSNEEISYKRSNNRARLVLPVETLADVDIRGVSWPDDVIVYNKSLYGSGLLGPGRNISYEGQIGPSVSHVYEVTNRGPSLLRRAQLLLLWPSRTFGDKPLLYLTKSPAVEPSLQCVPIGDLNYLDIDLVRPKNRRSVDGSEAPTAATRSNDIPQSLSPYHPYESTEFQKIFRGESGGSADLSSENKHSSYTDDVDSTRGIGGLSPERLKGNNSQELSHQRSNIDYISNTTRLPIDFTSFTDSDTTSLPPELLSFPNYELGLDSTTPNPKDHHPQELVSKDSLSEEVQFFAPMLRDSSPSRRDRRDSETDALSCGASNCSRMVCLVTNLEAGEHIVVRVHSRLWVDTIEALGMSEVTISSRLVVRTLPATPVRVNVDGGDPDGEVPDWAVIAPMGGAQSKIQMWSGSASSVVRASVEPIKSSIEWIIILGSILVGLFLLALLILILWALGFFKRRRVPHDASEQEPLRPNGFYASSSRT